MTDLSIIIVNHDHLPFLKTGIPSLYGLDSKSTVQVVLVDNASRDGAYEWTRENYPQIEIIRNNIQKGYTENANLGIRALQNGRYVILMNPDIVCLPGLLDELTGFMDRHPDVGIAGPKLLNPDLSIQPSCRRFSTPETVLLRGLHLDGIFRRKMAEYLMADFDHNSVTDVDWVSGALLIVRPEAIAQVGLMDEDRYFLYSEDQDWCCRMWHKGWRVAYVPQAKAIHVHLREGIRKPWSRSARWQLKSAFRMFQKFGWRLTRRL